MTDTIRRVARPRGELPADTKKRLERLRAKADTSEADYRAAVIDAHRNGASFSTLRAELGHSTSTLQAWKKDHDDDH